MRRILSITENGREVFPLSTEIWELAQREMQLSPQQLKIVELILMRKTDRQIASALGLMVPTIRTYLQRIFQRLEVSDRLELVLHILALSHDLRDRKERRA